MRGRRFCRCRASGYKIAVESGRQRRKNGYSIRPYRDKQEVDGRSDPWLAAYADMAADQPHKCAYLREPQTGAPVALGREKWIKGFPNHFRRHALSAVSDADSNVASRRRRARGRGFYRPSLCADPDLAPIWHGVARVDDKV